MAVERFYPRKHHFHAHSRPGVVQNRSESARPGHRPGHSAGRRLDPDIWSFGGTTSTVRSSAGCKCMLTDSVALARAVYGRSDTYILDDVFSALDATTEAHVFGALFGPGGLLEGRSVILATNQVYRLTKSSFVSCLENGSITEQGVFTDLMTQENGVVAGLMAEYAAGSKETSRGAEEPARDALAEPAEDAKSERSSEPAEGSTGSVAWSTYGLYLRGMGMWHGIICEFCCCRAKALMDRVLNDSRHRHRRGLHQRVSPGLDHVVEAVFASSRVRRILGRLRRHAAGLPLHILRGYLQRISLCPSDR